MLPLAPSTSFTSRRMAWRHFAKILTCIVMVTGSPTPSMGGGGIVTCPGFPGYCSESYPGDTCLVVCAYGRNNVPECQSDGTWTDIPRCVEHEPGIPEQVPGICPGIPGYCSLDYSGGTCEFDCPNGPDIRSYCTPDGTWDPYPTCDGDMRETRDGCDPCPGPNGGPRNRTSEPVSKSGPTKNKASNPRNLGPTSQASAVTNNRQWSQQPEIGNTDFQQASKPLLLSNPVTSPPPQWAESPTNKPKQFEAPSNSNPGSWSNSVNSGGNQKMWAKTEGLGGFSKGSSPVDNLVVVQTTQHPEVQRPAQNNPVSSFPIGGCPGGSLEVCIDVCPSDSLRVFGACVNGCAKRCPARK